MTQLPVYMLVTVSVYRWPQRERWRDAYVKFFQKLQYYRKKKTLKDFKIEEESSLCRIFARNVGAHMNAALV